jgi:dihydrodipicolinate synthase/N-acetylneuraminate lyase
MVELYNKYPGKDVGKVILQMKGIPIGPPRLPQIPFNDQEYQDLENKLKLIGVL